MRIRKLNATWVALALLAAAGLLLPASALAATDPATDEGWRLRFYAASIDFHNQNRGGPGFPGGGYDVDVGGAVGINAEYRLNRRLGIDLGALVGGGVDLASRTGWVGDSEFLVYDTLTFSALTAGLDVHLTPDSRADLYVCPMLALMQYGGIVVDNVPGTATWGIDFDEDLALGATLGLAIPFGPESRWRFNAHVTHLESTLDGTNRGGLRLAEDYDATLLGLGVGYRF